MRVKRYVVNALPEAVSMIRTDLGKDAVILDSKEIRVGGFMGMFGKKKMEVIAAVETGAQKNAETQQRKPSPEVNAVVEQILQTAQRSNTAVMEPPQLPTVPIIEKPSDKRIEREQFIIDEIRDLREYMVKLTKQQSDHNTLSEPLLALKDRLILQEMEHELVDKLIDTLLEEQKQSERIFDNKEVWLNATRIIEGWLEPYSKAQLNTEVRVLHFVGPTGVGKTTTIAKLAAEQTIKLGKKVGFITSDTYRIAAVDQLRTYANILNVPLEVVFSPMDLPKAHKQLESRDLILMDTAGRNFRSELHVSEVNSLLQTKEPSETILVLSLTGKTTDMAIVAERFSKFGINKVLFTKLDETIVYGAILNLILKYELYPTHMASGQTVPDDIEPFQAKKYVQMLLGASEYE
ncbi:flagellar biosynthesis protein FlhF [Paenibacillus sp. GSMTC-2017]|uniref:flagellar biosynthesis protein FlhF n=1 Tax=Paenibacillus sp. GSMTC-2017 TaxID=2794350 RepID=UPI0018D67857|nr:flagellar biosynthesis protein FlhF [Paenibacillus sp. GSMTC-2017]MBH5316624.1 flagellar biosynthesis protein FlhF [Paenibacillus sp. GSMTC-2017]